MSNNKKMVVINPKEVEVFECGPIDAFPKIEGYSILDTRAFFDGFHMYHFIRKDASFLEKLKILFLNK